MFSHYNTYADIKRRKNESRTYFFDRAAEPQDDAGRGGGTEEAVKQENKR